MEKNRLAGIHMEVLPDIYRAGVNEERWPTTLDAICRSLGLKDIAIFSAEPDTTRLSKVVNSTKLPRHLHALYLEQFVDLDQQILRLLSGDERTLTGTDLMSDDEVQQCPVHNDYLIPHGIDHQLVYFARTPLGGKHTLSFILQDADQEVAARDKILSLVPHLRTSLEIGEQAHQVEHTLDALEYAVFDLAPDDRVTVANAKAEALLQRDVLRLDAYQRLRGRGALWEREISAAVANTRERSRYRKLMQTADGYYAIAGSLSSRAHILITIRDYTTAAQNLRTTYHLTPTESRLALHLYFGGSIDSFAAENGTSKNTVRSQIRMLFEKTGTSRQKDLVVVIGSGL